MAYLDNSGLSYLWGKIKALVAGTNYAASTEPEGNAIKANGILFGQVDSTSTATHFTATIPGVTEYYDGLTIMLKNGVVTSASGFTININGLGEKHAYNNMTAATAETTLFNINYTMLFVYDSTRVSGGGWVCYRGYDANTNTIGYQLRTNSSTRPASDKFYRYRILFESANGKKWIPSNTSTSTNATAARAVNQRPINPFGDIVYYGSTSVVEAGANVGAASIWQEYTMTFGYAFNRTGAALVMPYPSPIYIKCAPQSDGSAIIDADNPYVFDLPSTDDGKIYIYLGRTYSATQIELVMVHPIYYYKNGAVRQWTNSLPSGGTALTDQEIEDAVESAFPIVTYSISYAYDYIKTEGNLMSVSTDGSKVLGEYATTAEEGATITMWFAGRYEPIVTRSDTSAEITCTRIEVDTSSGRKTTWTCTMPGVGIVINSYYND